MNLRIFSLLAIAVMATLLMFLQPRGETGDNSPVLFFPDLKQNIDKLERIEIRHASTSFQIKKQNDRWVVPERDNYPADLAKLSTLVQKLGGVKSVEKKTTRPENYARLNVADPSAQDSNALLVSGSAGDYSFSVLVGKSATGRSGRFVRRPEDDQVWLIDKDIDIDVSPAAWLEPIILDIDSGRINRVEQFDSSGVQQFQLVRQEEGSDFDLVNMPDGRALKYPSITNDLPRTLSSLRLKDVMRHREDSWPTSAVTKTVFQIDADLQLTVASAEFDGAQWLHITSSRRIDSESGEDAATDFDSLSQWDFQVTSLVYEDFIKTLDDLLTSVEPEPGS